MAAESDGHKQRNSSFELLRILCMLFVIGGHLIGKGMQIPYDKMLAFGGQDYVFARLLYSFCVVAVDTFILISGYFGIKSNWNKIVKIWFSVLFYSWLVAVYKIVVEKELVSSLPYILPITSNEFWFLSCYFVLCAVAPLLNKLAEKLSRKDFVNILLLCFVIIYGWASFNYILNFRQFIPDFGGGIINFSILYLIGRYIRLYGFTDYSSLFYLGVFVGNTILMVCMELLFSSIFHFGFTSFENINSIFVVSNAVFLFLFFKKLHFHNKYVNLLAVYCLSVYIIHCNDIGLNFLTDFFHLKNLHGFEILWSVLFIPPVVYIVCSVFEWGRRSLFSKMENMVLGAIVRRWKSDKI